MRKSEAFRKPNKKKLFQSIIVFILAALMFIHVSAVFASSDGEEGDGGGGITVIPDKSVIIQAINFLILIWVLNMVLYKPIRNILIQRKEKISGLERDVDIVEAKAVEQDSSFSDGIKKARAEGLRKKETLLQTAMEEETEIIQKIQEKAQSELIKVREQITRETEDARASLLKEVESFASAISQKILGRVV